MLSVDALISQTSNTRMHWTKRSDAVMKTSKFAIGGSPQNDERQVRALVILLKMTFEVLKQNSILTHLRLFLRALGLVTQC